MRGWSPVWTSPRDGPGDQSIKHARVDGCFLRTRRGARSAFLHPREPTYELSRSDRAIIHHPVLWRMKMQRQVKIGRSGVLGAQGVRVHELMVTFVHQKTRRGRLKAPPDSGGPKATPEGASVGSDRSGQARTSGEVTPSKVTSIRTHLRTFGPNGQLEALQGGRPSVNRRSARARVCRSDGGGRRYPCSETPRLRSRFLAGSICIMCLEEAAGTEGADPLPTRRTCRAL